MTEHYDGREIQTPARREADLFARLPRVVAKALAAPGWARHLGDLDGAPIDSRAALARLPVLRKSDLPALQQAEPPLGGLLGAPLGTFGRVFVSPGPIVEAEPRGDDPWRAARGLYAAGLRPGDIMLNTFSYHMTPGGLMLDSGARALGCAVIPAGPGQTDQQLAVIARLQPVAYTGTPDFLKILIDAAEKAGQPAASIRKAVVSGAAFPATLRDEFRRRGLEAYQIYATADVGVVAYESQAREGLIVNEDIIVEIVQPGTGDPAPDGDVGEVVVTVLDPHHPIIRLALGDLSAVLPGPSPCGRTNQRIKGWLGRADQAAKVKGLFVRPEQIAAIGARHAGLGRLRLVVSRAGEQDVMTLQAETAAASPALQDALAVSLQTITQLRGQVELVAPGSLPNDGKVIADIRPIG
jgi:phenylacetate-CoA ligase